MVVWANEVRLIQVNAAVSEAGLMLIVSSDNPLQAIWPGKEAALDGRNCVR
jgi:hypothetical protein